jgi:hypothetical protein
MPGLLALVLAASVTSLPPLPQRGLALETKAGVQLQSLDGRPLASLPGVDLALDQATAHVVVLRTIRGRLYSFDGRTLRPRAPHSTGRWVWTERSPAGDAVLAQRYAECEIPIAYLIVHGKPRKVADETVALGWLPTGEAVVQFRPLGCAGSGRRGIYAVPVSGMPRLVLRTPRFAQYLMWGG